MTSPLAWLLPAPIERPTVVHRDEVGAIGWQVLLRDGALEHVWGDLAVPAGRRPGRVERACALAPFVPARAVVGRMAAAWVHTGRIPPASLDLLVEPGHRRLAPDPSRRTRECPLPRADVDDLGGVRVTSVQRTGLDLARWGAPSDPGVLTELDALLGLGFDPIAALVALGQLTGQRGLRTAREVLARLDPRADRRHDRGRPPGPSSDPDRRLVGVARARDPVDVEHALDLADRREHGGEV